MHISRGKSNKPERRCLLGTSWLAYIARLFLLFTTRLSGLISPSSQQIRPTIPLRQTAVHIMPSMRANRKETSEADGIILVGSTSFDDNGTRSAVDSSPKGPDRVISTDSFTTTNADGAVKLKVERQGTAALPAISVPTLLQQSVDRYGDHPALCVKRDNQWAKWTYKQYQRDVMVCAKAFIKLGLERFHSVCIIGFNSPEWLIADLAAIHAGGFAAGIYTTNSAEACLHCAVNGKCDIMVVEDRKQLEKILLIRDRIPTLKAIVQYTGIPDVEGVLSWDKLMDLGKKALNDAYKERLGSLAINQCCTVIYTSGTTGPPKGVMLSHDNLTWISNSLTSHFDIRKGKESIVSYLPLSHVAAQVTDIYMPMLVGGTVYFAQPDALKGSLIDTVREVRPTALFGVPRVWEKMHEKMQEVGKNTKGVQRSVAKWSMGVGLDYNRRRMNGKKSKPFGYGIANALVFKKVRKGLGMEKTTHILSGAAPLSQEVAEYFMSLNIPIMEVYGMSESTGPHSINDVTKGFQLNSGGKTTPGATTRIKNADKDGNGEIQLAGRHIFMGYLQDPANTASAIDADGYVNTGDVGRVDKNGFIFITGRIKELLITAGGENVAPVIIEDNIKAELPAISQAMVVGDRRKFLSVLLTLKTEMNAETMEPLPKLTRPVKEWCNEAGLKNVETVADVIDAVQKGDQYADVNRFVQTVYQGLERANRKAISGAQRVQKWAFLPVDFSIPGGELGPTMKIKRSYVVEKYADVIDKLYA